MASTCPRELSHPVPGRGGAGLRSYEEIHWHHLWRWGGAGKDSKVHRETNPSSQSRIGAQPRPTQFSLCGGGTLWAAVPPSQLLTLSQAPPDGWCAVRTAQGKAPGTLLPGTPGGAALGQQADVGTCAGSARAPSLCAGPVGVLLWVAAEATSSQQAPRGHTWTHMHTHTQTHSPPSPPSRSCKRVQPAKCEASGEARVCADLETL